MECIYLLDFLYYLYKEFQICDLNVKNTTLFTPSPPAIADNIHQLLLPTPWDSQFHIMSANSCYQKIIDKYQSVGGTWYIN